MIARHVWKELLKVWVDWIMEQTTDFVVVPSLSRIFMANTRTQFWEKETRQTFFRQAKHSSTTCCIEFSFPIVPRRKKFRCHAPFVHLVALKKWNSISGLIFLSSLLVGLASGQYLIRPPSFNTRGYIGKGVICPKNEVATGFRMKMKHHIQNDLSEFRSDLFLQSSLNLFVS